MYGAIRRLSHAPAILVSKDQCFIGICPQIVVLVLVVVLDLPFDSEGEDDADGLRLRRATCLASWQVNLTACNLTV